MTKISTSTVFALLFSITTLATLSSCEKYPGHPTGVVVTTSSGTNSSGSTGGTGSSGSTGSTGSGTTVNPNAGTPNANGIGPVAVGASNTIIFQINGGSAITANVGTGFSCVDYGGGFVQTGLFGFISSSSTIVGLTYLGNGVGTYPGTSSSIKSGAFDLTDKTGTEKINVTSSNVTPSTLASLATPPTGTIKGTFDGKMVDANSGLSFRVSGSFNITQ